MCTCLKYNVSYSYMHRQYFLIYNLSTLPYVTKPRVQNEKIFESIHLRWFIIHIRIIKKPKKILFFNCKFLIEENEYKCEPEVLRQDFRLFKKGLNGLYINPKCNFF